MPIRHVAWVVVLGLVLGATAPARAGESADADVIRQYGDGPDLPLTLGTDIYWGGDGLGAFGLRPTLNLRGQRWELIGRGVMPFEYAPGEFIHPYFSGYLRIEGGAFVVVRKHRGMCGAWLERKTEIARSTDTVTYAVRQEHVSYPCERRAGLDFGGAWAQERTLGDGDEHVGMMQVYGGIRAREIDLDDKSSMSVYVHGIVALNHKYPGAYVPPAEQSEGRLGARLGFDMEVPLTGHYAFTMGFDVGLYPTTYPSDRWFPAFRMFLSAGVEVF